MSRFPLLTSALLSALALSNVGGLCCPVPVEGTRIERLKRGELAVELEACYQDDLACEVFCSELLAARGYHFESGFPPQIIDCVLEVDEAGPEAPIVSITYTIPEHCIGGRRPAAVSSTPTRAANPVATYLAGVAHLEAISVHAFAELAADLAEHGAPRALVRRALACAADEVDHAGAVATLAKKRGASIEVPSVGRRTTRSLAAIAMTNAVEGCVRELYGALVALWQGQHAADAEIREVFSAIAQDELRHAELAFDIHRWAMGHIDAAAQSRVISAREQASAALIAIAGDEGGCALAAIGLPSQRDAKELAAAVANAAASLELTG